MKPKNSPFLILLSLLAMAALTGPETGWALSSGTAFKKARGTYEGIYKSPEFGRLPAETKLPNRKGTAVVNKMLPQDGFPPAEHIEKYKITKATTRQGGKKVVMKGRLVKSIFGGSGVLRINVNVKPAKPKLENSKTAGTGVWGGNGALTGKKS